MITVTGTYQAADGSPAVGTVTFQPQYVARYDPIPALVTQNTVTATLDASGAFSVELLASDDPDWGSVDDQGQPAPVPYVVRENMQGLRQGWMGYFNGPGPVDVSDVVPLAQAPDVYIPVPGPPGDPGPQGPQGPPGPPGEDGQDFTPGDADARYVFKAGDTLTGDLVVSKPGSAQIRAESTGGQPTIRVSGPTGQGRNFVFQTSGSWRWSIGANSATETGDDNGSNFDFARYSDSGSWLGTPLSIRRSSGVVTFAEMPQVGSVPVGARVTHPNTDDVLVQTWDHTLGRWQTVYYDSGVRGLNSFLVNGWASRVGAYQALTIRRINNTVFVACQQSTTLSGLSATDRTIANIPAGFRPTGVGLFWLFDDGVLNGANLRGGAYPNSPWLFATNATSYATTQYWRPNGEWTTADPVPTSLPGTLVSPAPN